MLQKYPTLDVLDSTDEDPETQTECNKDTGDKFRRLQKWIRVVDTFRYGNHYNSKVSDLHAYDCTLFAL